MRHELPKTCYAVMPDSGALVILKRGEKGQDYISEHTASRAENQKIADFNNQRYGIGPAQVKAMVLGSIHGFDHPLADPQLYFDEARHVSTHSLGLSAVLYADGSLHDRIGGDVYQYEVAGEECFYLNLASLPERIMGIRSEGTILADMVHGRPLVPVTLKWMENNGCEMTLDHGAFTYDKEMNEGYQIAARIRVGPVEYVLGELDGKWPSFVTWERTPANDGDGPPNYYWGHYHESRKAAIEDFCDRAQAKHEMLLENRKPSVKAKLAAKPVPGEHPSKPKNQEAR